jgi:hypothetical protein
MYGGTVCGFRTGIDKRGALSSILQMKSKRFSNIQSGAVAYNSRSGKKHRRP